MKSYNCPDCLIQDFTGSADLCSICVRNKNNTYQPIPSIPNIVTVPDYSKDYDPCEHCSGNPKNGGSGFCHCTLPYMYGKYRITCSTN